MGSRRDSCRFSFQVAAILAAIGILTTASSKFFTSSLQHEFQRDIDRIGREISRIDRGNSMGSGEYIRITDCSKQVQEEQAELPMWKEKSAWMNVTWRAEAAIELLNKFGAFKEPGSLLVDMGAGFQALRNFTPTGIEYAPVDITERVRGSRTTICDLNRHEFPFFRSRRIAAFTFLGSFEYVLDKMSVLHLCRSRDAPAFFHYQLGMKVNQASFSWVAPLDIKSFKEATDIVGYELEAFDIELNPLNVSEPEIMHHEGALYVYLRPK